MRTTSPLEPRPRQHLAGWIGVGVALCIASLAAACKPAPQLSERVSSAQCEFGPAQRLAPPVSSPVFDGSPTVSDDETELFFTSERNGTRDLFVSTRPDREASWGQPANLGSPIDDSTAGDFSLRLSSDGKALFFTSTRAGGFGKADLYVATRESRKHPWSPARNLGPGINTDAFEAFPAPNADGTMLYFNRSTDFDSQDSDIWIASRAGPGELWGQARRAPGLINSEGAEFSPSLSTDGKSLYFASARGGSIEVWVSTRVDQAHDWSRPERLGANINVPLSLTLAPFISGDQQSLYFMSARPDSAGGAACTPMTCFKRVDLYVAKRSCRD